MKSINYMNINYSYAVSSFFNRFVFVFLGAISFICWEIHKYFVKGDMPVEILR
jgi:hypothetical protein